MSNPQIRETDIPLSNPRLIRLKHLVGEFMSPLHIPILRRRTLVIAYTTRYCPMNILPYPRAKAASGQGIPDEEEMFSRGYQIDGFSDRAMRDFAFIRRPDEFPSGTSVHLRELLRGQLGVSGKVSPVLDVLG